MNNPIKRLLDGKNGMAFGDIFIDKFRRLLHIAPPDRLATPRHYCAKKVAFSYPEI